MLESITGLEFVASGKRYYMTHGTKWDIPEDFDRQLVDLLDLDNDVSLAQFISSYYYTTHTNEDINEYVEIVNCANNQEMDPLLLIETFDEKSSMNLSHVISHMYNSFYRSILLIDDMNIIGAITFNKIENGKYDIAYYLGKQYRGMKIMSNAMNILILNLSMSTIKEINISCRESNIASKKIIERIASHFEVKYDAYYEIVDNLDKSKIEKTMTDTKLLLNCVIEKTFSGKIFFNRNC